MDRTSSAALYKKLKTVTPGGVSSPVRAFDPHPIAFSSGRGCILSDIDGNDYVDMCMAYGPLIMGHAHPSIVHAVKEQIEKGSAFGAPSVPEFELISEIMKRVPCADMVRLCNSGTEATMHAVRLARGFTGKNGIIKIRGGFHGSHDTLLAEQRSRSEQTAPSSKGVLPASVSETYSAEYNSEEDLESILQKNDIAAVIMEPVLGNVGVITPKKNYLKNVRKMTQDHGTLLIFDEVITGFRSSPGGAQETLGVTPDICTLGKIMGGGLPAGAIAGRKEIMEHFAPCGPVYQAGTFSGNPLTAAAGVAAIKNMTPLRYKKLNEISSKLTTSISDILEDKNVPACVSSFGSMFQIFFGIGEVNNASEAKNTDVKTFKKMFTHMLDSNVYVPPSPFEVNFLCTEHGNDQVKKFSEEFDSFLRTVKE